jgi:putative flippase GtrA
LYTPLDHQRHKKKTIRKLLIFGLIGILNTGLHTIFLTVALFELHLNYGVGNVSAYLLTSVISFILNARFTFRVKKTPERFARFQIIGGATGAACYALGLFAETYGLNYLVLVLLTALILPLITFTLHRRFSFR